MTMKMMINSFWEMIMLSVATSLDAMAVGLTFAFLPINVWEASTMIGVITFGISLIGVYLGKFMGQFVGKYADILGGGCIDSHRYKNTFTTPRYYWRVLEVCIYMKVS